MTSESVTQLVDQPRAEVPTVISQLADIEQRLDFIGIIESGQGITEELIEIPRLLGGFRRETLAAPDTQRLVLGRLLLTAGAFERRNVLLVRFFDILTVQFPILPIRAVATEAGDIPGGMLTATLSSLSILDESLRSPLSRQPTGIRLSEIRRRTRLVDTRTLRGLFKHLEITAITQLGAIRQRTPQRGVGRLACRMFDEPPLDVGDARNQVDRPLAGFAVDRDDKAGISIGQILDLEGFEFAATESGIELQGNRGFVTRIATCIKHVLNFIVPSQHLGWIRHRIVVRRQRRRDPGQRRGDAVALCCSLAKHPEGNTIVLIRLRRFVEIVFAMDPPDQLLGGTLLSSSVNQAHCAEFGHPNAMTEQLTMTIPSVRLTQYQHLIRKSTQRITVGIATTTIAGVNLLTKSVNSLPGRLASCHAVIKLKCEIMKLWCRAHPWLLTFSSPSHRKSVVAADSEVMG